MRLRLLAAAAATATCAIALPSHGATAPKPQIIDAKGDGVIPSQPSLDIVSGLFATSGTTATVKGKKVYTPKKLEVTITYDAAPSTNPFATQVVTFNLPGCGAVYLQKYFGGTWGFADCVEGSFDITVAAKGSTLQYTVPFSALAKSLKAGAKLGSLRTYVTGAEPAAGTELSEIQSDFVNDEGTGSSYTVA